ncbi:cob(I)yrinic acid a,c-diamide adenosyltransferase [Candidatus Saccharibacteria bacterium]|nr:cob(I)yrinic acid a,c-diamide adenosyltransferase [Candidatus Saccharibacteria bacterium]
MSFEDFETKESVVLVYTGDGKGKTSASVGLLARALGRDWKVAYVQFVKTWETGESKFIDKVVEAKVFGDKLFYFRGGRGFYNAGDISAKNVTEAEHKKAALDTFNIAIEKATSGDWDLVICDEINNSVHDGLLPMKKLENLLTKRSPKTSICVTGRNFPKELLKYTDIATDMTKIKHHFDDKFLANKGIDY